MTLREGVMFHLGMQTPTSPLSVRVVPSASVRSFLHRIFERFGDNDPTLRPGFILTREHDAVISCGALRDGTVWSTNVIAPQALVSELGCGDRPERAQKSVRLYLPFGSIVERQLYTEFGRLTTAIDFCVPPELGRYLAELLSTQVAADQRVVLLEAAYRRLASFIESLQVSAVEPEHFAMIH